MESILIVHLTCDRSIRLSKFCPNSVSLTVEPACRFLSARVLRSTETLAPGAWMSTSSWTAERIIGGRVSRVESYIGSVHVALTRFPSSGGRSVECVGTDVIESSFCSRVTCNSTGLLRLLPLSSASRWTHVKLEENSEVTWLFLLPFPPPLFFSFFPLSLLPRKALFKATV